MTSPREDMDILLDEGIEAATQFLEKNGEFCPFAIVLSTEGEVRYVQCEPEDEFTQSEGLIEITEHALRELAQQGDVRATALVSDVFIHGKNEPGAETDAEVEAEPEQDTDAIRIALEHISAGAVTCYLPYTIGEDEIDMGELVAEEGDPVIFASKDDDAPETHESSLN